MLVKNFQIGGQGSKSVGLDNSVSFGRCQFVQHRTGTMPPGSSPRRRPRLQVDFPSRVAMLNGSSFPSKEVDTVPDALRSRMTLGIPITLGVVLMTLNITLMVFWIAVLARSAGWSALIIGVAVFALILVGLSFYLFLMIKEVRLNQRQANFIDSVTHELKSPISSLRLYLETLEMRSLSDEQRTKFYRVMEEELERLDHLITQLLEVGRIDAIGAQSDPEELSLEELLRKCGAAACAHHKRDEAETIDYDFEPMMVFARRLVLETIFRNLLDNAIKYAGDPPRVEVQVRDGERGRVVVRIIDNGLGVPHELRKRIFGMFFRGGSELTRRQKGTGLGLYIVHTLVKLLKGRVSVHDRPGQSGSVFEVDLPGHRAFPDPASSAR